jgi:hypothetical protein
MIWVDLLVSRHQKVSYSCSSTTQALFPLGADCVVEEWWWAGMRRKPHGQKLGEWSLPSIFGVCSKYEAAVCPRM